jgi:hypothetical protein
LNFSISLIFLLALKNEYLAISILQAFTKYYAIYFYQLVLFANELGRHPFRIQIVSINLEVLITLGKVQLMGYCSFCIFTRNYIILTRAEQAYLLKQIYVPWRISQLNLEVFFCIMSIILLPDIWEVVFHDKIIIKSVRPSLKLFHQLLTALFRTETMRTVLSLASRGLN